MVPRSLPPLWSCGPHTQRDRRGPPYPQRGRYLAGCSIRTCINVSYDSALESSHSGRWLILSIATQMSGSPTSRPPQRSATASGTGRRTLPIPLQSSVGGGVPHLQTLVTAISLWPLTFPRDNLLGSFCALKIAMEDGLCRVKWQPAANLSRTATWYGQDGAAGSPGFVVLPSMPRGPLKKIVHKRNHPVGIQYVSCPLTVFTCSAWNQQNARDCSPWT